MLKYWRRCELGSINVDSMECATVQREIIRKNRWLRSSYDSLYFRFVACLKASRIRSNLPLVEIGAATSYLDEFIPSLLKTDIVHAPGIASVVDGEQLPFKHESVGAFFLLNVLHHMRNPLLFLEQAERCLAPNGRLIMIEPSNSALYRFLVNKFSLYEYSDSSQEGWENFVSGRLSHANVALPWIMFVRDREKLEKRLSSMRIVEIDLCNNLQFYVSGGLYHRSFLPEFCIPLFRILEKLIPDWLGRLIGVQILIVLEKKQIMQAELASDPVTGEL